MSLFHPRLENVEILIRSLVVSWGELVPPGLGSVGITQSLEKIREVIKKLSQVMKHGARFMVACAVIYLALSAWNSLPAAAQESAGTSAIMLGFIAPLTGARASLGSDALAGARMALEEVNAPDRPRFTLAVEDSAGDPAKGVSAYVKVRAGGSKFVITQNSNVSLPIARLANSDGIVQLAISTTSEKYATPDDLTFRTNGDTKLEAALLAKTVGGEIDRAPGRLALITLEDEYPLSVRNSLLQELRLRGIKPDVEETFSAQEFDFRAILVKLKKAQADFVVVLAYYQQAGYFIKQLRELGVKPRLILGNLQLKHDDLLAIAGGAAEGLVVTDITYDETHPAAGRYARAGGRTMNFTVANGYDAVMLAAKAFAACGYRAEAQCLKRALFAIKEYHGLGGRKGFDAKFGDMIDYYRLMVVSRGKFIPLDR